jgi:serine/threonine protein kinase
LLTAREEALARFQAELRTLMRLEHEGIARLYDGGIATDPHTQEPLPYFAMQLVHEGQPITTYAQACHLTVPRKLALFVQVCDAVREAHRYRILHRDLKPGNILVNSDNAPIVIDFGLARAYDVMVSDAWRLSGTLAYTSPEQIAPTLGQVGFKSDVYALGVILYELLTGHLPYEVPPQSSLEQWRQVITETKPPLLRHYSKPYRRELDGILSAALAKRPEDRLTLDVLRARIARVLEARRRPSPLGVALGMGLLAVGMLQGVLWYLPPSPTKPAPPAAHTLAGIIWDDDHQLLAGVEVWLSDINRTITTDQHGHFAFTDIRAPQRDVRLIARKAGYHPYEAYATLGDPAFTIRMRKQP